jgi:hypothetical protein
VSALLGLLAGSHATPWNSLGCSCAVTIFSFTDTADHTPGLEHRYVPAMVLLTLILTSTIFAVIKSRHT